jgi:hypothetical protein
MNAPSLSLPRVAILILSAAVPLGACSSSPSGSSSGDPTAGQDAAGPGGGDSASTGHDEASADQVSSETSVLDGGGPPDESAPDEGTIVDAGMAETLVGEGGLMVTWTEGCWYETGGMKYQAMSFTVESSTPLPLEGTLFYNATCDPSDGTDNLNDTGGTTPSGSWIFWFIHHPGLTNSSAIWSYGGIMSACINYNVAPDC